MAKKKKAIEDLDFIELVEIIKSRGRVKKQKVDNAYNEMERRMKTKMLKIISQFFIPGCNRDDIYQESLFALRFKAIPDFKKNIEGKFGPYPFDKFAILCIRRHLSTLLKSSFQNKRKALNTSLSLDQDRNESSNDALFLSDIIPRQDGTVLDSLENKEYYDSLFRNLFSKLSKFEKKVFLLYIQKYSYEQMAVIINKHYRKNKSKKRIKIKSIDNALSRIKIKSQDIFKKFGEL